MKKITIVFSLVCTMFLLGANDTAWISKTFPPQLITASGKQVNSADVLKGKTVAVYFSASWCPPCRQFTPQLVKFYKRTAKKENIEIVLVSSDKTEKAMTGYVKKYKMPWLTVPFGHPAAAALKKSLKVSGIPALIVFSPAGKIVSQNGRGDVARLGNKAAAAWTSSAAVEKDGQANDAEMKDAKPKKTKEKKTKEKKKKKQKNRKSKARKATVQKNNPPVSESGVNETLVLTPRPRPQRL
jgi:nucleoredoxin